MLLQQKKAEIARLAKAEGGYQPVLFRGKVINSGWRSCYNRWTQIFPHLSNGQTVMDIGSHYGYFTYEIARKFPGSFVWSIEEGEKRAEIQKMMLEINTIKNAALSQVPFTLKMAEELESTCFTADVILLLSVAHYFPKNHLSAIIGVLSRLSPTLIIEFPSHQEIEVSSKTNVTGVNIKTILDKYYKKVEVIGTGTSPKHFDVGRKIYKCSNETLVRFGCRSYIGSPSRRVKELLYQDGQWNIDNQPRAYPGLTLDDLRHYKMVYPDVDATLMDAAITYDDLSKARKGRVTDINIRNVVMTPKGLQVIDFLEGLDKPFIYDIPLADYIERTKNRTALFHFDEFRAMWNGTWVP